MTPISRIVAGALTFATFWLQPRKVWRLREDFAAQTAKLNALIHVSDHDFLAKHGDAIDNTLLPRATGVVRPAADGESVYRKIYRTPKGTGITARQAFFLELDCLSRINQLVAEKNIPRHFPTLHGFSVSELSMDLSDDGNSLDKLQAPMVVPELDRQVDDIVATLGEANIWHLDIHQSGKNILIDQAGRLTLIDFDRAVIDNKPLTPLVAKKLPTTTSHANYHRGRIMRCLDNHPLIIAGEQ